MATLIIKDVIKRKGLTQRQVAETLGIAEMSLSNQINGNPTIETLTKIATAIGVETHELFAKQKHTFNCPHCNQQIIVAKPQNKDEDE